MKVAVQSSGKIAVADGANGFNLLRFNGDGSPDTAFGSGGKVSVPFEGGRAFTVAIQRDGKIVAGGFGRDSSDSTTGYYRRSGFALARLIGDESSSSIPRLSIGSNIAVDEGVGSVVLAVTISARSSSAVSVNYATSDKNATAGADYTAVSGTLTWAPGDTSAKTITVPIIDDTIVEPSEFFHVTLSSPVNATLGRATATVKIGDNDAPPRRRR